MPHKVPWCSLNKGWRHIYHPFSIFWTMLNYCNYTVKNNYTSIILNIRVFCFANHIPVVDKEVTPGSLTLLVSGDRSLCCGVVNHISESVKSAGGNKCFTLDGDKGTPMKACLFFNWNKRGVTCGLGSTCLEFSWHPSIIKSMKITICSERNETLLCQHIDVYTKTCLLTSWHWH